MATRTFRGDAQNVIDTWTFLISSTTNTHTFTLTRNGKSYTVTADGVLTAAQLATALQVLLAASTEPEFAEYTWTVDTATITGTSKVTGRPATFTKSGTGTSTLTNTLAGTGANTWKASNFDGGLPATGDEVYFHSTDTPVLYGINQTGVALDILDVSLSYEANIGNPPFNTSGSEPYYEDRQKPLLIGASIVRLGTGSGRGGGCWYLRLEGSGEVLVYGSGTSDDPNYHPIRIEATTNSLSSISVFGGAVDFDPYSQGTSTLTEANISGGGVLRAGGLMSVASINVTGNGAYAAFIDNAVNPSTLLEVRDNGRAEIDGTGSVSVDTIVTVTVLGGSVRWRAKGRISTLAIGANAVMDFSSSPYPVTVTNCSMTAGATLLDPNGMVTFTNPIALTNCGLEDVRLVVGRGITIQRVVS